MASYNAGNPSDMKKLQKDMESAVLSKAKEAISSKEIEIECPKCKAKIGAVRGTNTCPKCGGQIDLQINFNF